MQKIFDKDVIKDIFYNDFISHGFVSWSQLYERLTKTKEIDQTPVNNDDFQKLKDKVSKYESFFSPNGMPSEISDYKWYYGRRYDAQNMGLKHRIYINFKRQDVVKMADAFIGKCIKNDVKFVFKFTKYPTNYDKFIIYATDEQLPVYKTILEELKNEYSDVFDRLGEPPITSYYFDNNFGYAPEIENSGTSFNQRCANALLEAFRTTLNDLTQGLKLDDYDPKVFLEIFLHNNLTSLSDKYGEDKDTFRINFPRKEFIEYFEKVKPKFIECINDITITNENLKNNTCALTFSLKDRKYSIYMKDILDLKKNLYAAAISKHGEEIFYEYLTNKVKEIFTRDDLVFDLPKELSNVR